jgi:biotin synthase
VFASTATAPDIPMEKTTMIRIDTLDKSGVIQWLKARGAQQQELFRQARAVRAQHGADEVLLRGVIEISNHCEKACNYCAMRCQNRQLERYRMKVDEILAIAAQIKSRDINTAFLQAGQDRHSDAILEEVIPTIKDDLGMNVLLCVGERSKEVYQHYVELGADAYILKYESADPQYYRYLANVSPTHRLTCMQAIRDSGMRLGTGNMVGLPHQTLEHVADDFFFALQVQPDFVSTAPFIPNQHTPFENYPSGDIDVALNLMALWRIALPTALIPTVSALEKLRPHGQLAGLNAGANVMTINFTPEQCRAKYAIYSEQRFVVSLKHALETVKLAGMQVRTELPALSAA